MDNVQIINIPELLRLKPGETYGGEVAVFIPEHDQPFSPLKGGAVRVNAYSYAIVLEGSAVLSVDGTDYFIEESSICALSPLHLTSFHSQSSNFRCAFLAVTKGFVDRLHDVDIGRLVAFGMNAYRQPVFCLTREEREQIMDSVRDIGVQILRTGHLCHLKLVQNALERFYLEADDALGRHAADPSADTPIRNSLLRRFMNLAISHYRKEHTVDFYANQLNITTQYLTRIVKTATGRTVSNFVYELLYCDARNLLSTTSMPIADIAEALHFADQASFSKFFARHSGVAPTAFRGNKMENC